ncbi:restriction endonuclease subunit S [Macrococcoides canis]|uniref:restriction endonuclease subunit S n=1 Tax=Macrococcoides canis TaxID=1855823 RepID=UPI0010FBFF04|nr:restriction endonuclease subunit S [Macrococcus canis]QCT75499.1 restriction endonuclease subunit S [Macrococcus canis]
MDEKKKNVPKRRFKEFKNADAWEQRELGEMLSYEQPTNYIVASSNYNNNFNTPVLTAGKSFILGYTNEINGIKRSNLNNPLIIFDDFTTSSHYVDFDFKVKSSALKILNTNSDDLNTYFVYNLLKKVNYKVQSHERHWISIYSKLKVLTTNLEEQNKIANFFLNIDQTITLHQRKLEKYKAIKESYLEEMFPAEGQRKPKRRFTGFTDDWEQRELGEICNITMGQSPDSINYTLNPLYHILVQGNADIKNSVIVPRIWTTQITKIALKNDIIFTVRAPVGDVAKNEFNLVIGRGVAAISGNEFIFQFLQHLKQNGYWKKLSSGSTFDSISSLELKSLPIKLPSAEEQKRIGELLVHIDQTITLHQKKLDKLKKLKEALLEEMFV